MPNKTRREEFDRIQAISVHLREIFKRDFNNDEINRSLVGMEDYVVRSVEEAIARIDSTVEPCPFCGYDKPFHENISRGDLTIVADYLVCGNCRAAGPQEKNVTAATLAWNNRCEKNG